MFRNLKMYRVHSAWPESETALSDQLAGGAFKPCGSFSERSSGWESPIGQVGTGPADAPLCRRLNGADLMRLRSQTRILPATAVNEALEGRIDEFKSRMLRDPTRKEKRQLKEETHSELLPKALLKSERTRGLFLLDDKLLVVDTASDNEAERFLDVLRNALGSLEAVPLTFKKPIAGFLTDLFLGSGARAFVLGRECRMEDPSQKGAYVQWVDVELADTSVRKHVRDGFKIDRLALEYDHQVSCVLDQQGVIRKLKLPGLDTADSINEDTGDSGDSDDGAIARLDSEFVMLTGSIRRLVGAIKNQLGGFG